MTKHDKTHRYALGDIVRDYDGYTFRVRDYRHAGVYMAACIANPSPLPRPNAGAIGLVTTIYDSEIAGRVDPYTGRLNAGGQLRARLAATRRERWRTLYRAQRDEGTRAKDALAIARRRARGVSLEWDTVHTRNGPVFEARTYRDGYELRIRVHEDMDGYASMPDTGTFTDRWQSGAIPTGNGDYRDGTPNARHTAPWPYRRDTWHAGAHADERYYVPPFKLVDEQRAYSRLGYARHDAYTRARALALGTMAHLLSDSYMPTYYGVTVDAFKDGIKLGDASLWGIDIGDNAPDSDTYIEDVAHELIPECLDDADNTLAGLTNSAPVKGTSYVVGAYDVVGDGKYRVWRHEHGPRTGRYGVASAWDTLEQAQADADARNAALNKTDNSRAISR